ncbi:hypothetical protein [Actinophytocola sp.]|uniref:hypothetical protein n=1 Tax=Actinophytocola sp. TaxID=1872138 RepID=UPI003D6A00B9
MNDDLPPGKPDETPDETSSETPDETPPEARDETPQDKAGRRTSLMIVAAAVVVLAAIGVGIYLVAASGDEDVAGNPSQPTITGTPPPDTPSSTPPPSEPPASRPTSAAAPPPPANENVAAARETAEQATTAINTRDVDTMRKLSCDPSTVGSVDSFPPRATARLAENPQITGDKATAQIELSIAGSEPTVVPVPMERRDGRWCVL